jgi:hypothetical protein
MQPPHRAGYRFIVGRARTLEETLHYHYRNVGVGHEWFRLTDQDVEDIATLPRAIDMAAKEPLQYTPILPRAKQGNRIAS